MLSNKHWILEQPMQRFASWQKRHPRFVSKTVNWNMPFLAKKSEQPSESLQMVHGAYIRQQIYRTFRMRSNPQSNSPVQLPLDDQAVPSQLGWRKSQFSKMKCTGEVRKMFEILICKPNSTCCKRSIPLLMMMTESSQ